MIKGMHKVWTALAFLLLLCVPRPAFALTVQAATCEMADLWTAYDAVGGASAVPGSEILVPSGSCAWSGFHVPSNVTLRAVGTVTVTMSGGVALYIDVSGGVATGRVTGFTFNCAMVQADGSGWRVDHNTFTCTYWTPIGVFAKGAAKNANVTGLVDHNQFHNASVYVYGFAGSILSDWIGDTQWTRALALGTAEAVYIEKNDFTFSVFGNTVDCETGGRYVFRQNTISDSYVEAHTARANVPSLNTVNGGFARGCRKWEIYDNTITMTSVGVANGANSRPFMLRGGTGVVYGNTVLTNNGGSWGTGDVVFDNVRSYCNSNTGIFLNQNCDALPLFYCSGTSPYDGNTTGLAGYPCLDQPGRGGDTVLLALGTYTQQTSDPVYVWNNTLNGPTTSAHANINPSGGDTGQSQNHIQSGRDFFVNVGAKPGYAAYIFPHPLDIDDSATVPAVNPLIACVYLTTLQPATFLMNSNGMTGLFKVWGTPCP